MATVLEKTTSDTILIEGEFTMTPTADPHNNFCVKLLVYLTKLLENTSLKVKYDTYRYLEADVINLFGNFKNGIEVDKFVRGLKRFGAPKEFIQRKIDEYAGSGVGQGAYAPDLFVVHRDDDYNRFSIPLLVIEVLSPSSYENDLYFKPFFYETIGVQEYFIGEAEIGKGRIVKAYRIDEEQYREVPLEDQGYFSKLLNRYLPEEWEV